MTKHFPDLALGLLLGAILGGAAIWWHLRRVVARDVLDHSAGSVAVAVSTLTLARAGDCDRLVRENEAALTSLVAGLAPAEPYLSKRQVKMLLAARRYYEKYPLSTGDTNQDAELTAFLQRIANSHSAAKVGMAH
jgi:hypothetical protein